MGNYVMDREDGDTLSFARMACNGSPSPETSRNTSPPDDHFFEFQTSPELSHPSSPADLLFSNGLLLPRSLPSEAGETDRRRCHKKPAGHGGSGQKLTMSTSKKVSFQTVDAGLSPQAMTGRTLRRVRNVGHHGQVVASPTRKEAEGRRGVFRFFTSACRECHALEPSSQVNEMRSLQACIISSNNYNGKIYRSGCHDVVIGMERGNSRK